MGESLPKDPMDPESLNRTTQSLPPPGESDLILTFSLDDSFVISIIGRRIAADVPIKRF